MCLTECNRKASTMRRHWPTGGCCTTVKKNDNKDRTYLCSGQGLNLFWKCPTRNSIRTAGIPNFSCLFSDPSGKYRDSISVNCCTRPVQKVSDLWSAKIQLFIWISETLIPVKLLSLVMHTLLPAVLPLLETFLERFLWNHVQLGCRIPHNVFSWLKSGPFQRHFQFRKQPKITRGPCRELESLSTQTSMSCAISRRSCYCSIISRFGTNFADTQIRSQNGMYRSSAYPHLVCQFSDTDMKVLHEQSPHLVDDIVISASWGPTRDVVRCQLIVLPSLKRLYHSFIRMILKASSPKACWIFGIVSTWVSPSFWQNLMQYRCSSRLVILQ